MDAQRARGFELDKVRGGVAARVRRLAPRIAGGDNLWVPPYPF